MTRYFEVWKNGKPRSVYEDKYAGDLTVFEINAKLGNGVSVKEISKEKFESFVKL